MHALRWVIRSVRIEPAWGHEPPWGRGLVRHRAPLGGKDRYRLKICFFVPLYSLDHRLMVVWYLLAMWQHAGRISWPSLGLRSVLLGPLLGRASGPDMIERLLRNLGRCSVHASPLLSI